MPSYTLSQDEERLVISWLFEPGGYLDLESIALGQTSRAALKANSNLNITQWVRDNGTDGWLLFGNREDETATQIGMIWWIWKNDGVNIVRSSRPPESELWVTIMEAWDDSISRGLIFMSRSDRNSRGNRATWNDIAIEDGSIPSGDYGIIQQQIISKVLGVLQ